MKPKPPCDLWAKLDTEMRLAQVHTDPKPPDGFTFLEFKEKFHLSEGQGRTRINRLLALGKVKKHGFGKYKYYTLCSGRS
jgi:hypothetical protein